MKKLFLLILFCGGTSLLNSQITFTTESLSINGSHKAVVDMNGDFLDDVVSVSASNVNIFYQLSTGGFSEVNITTPTADFPASWSLAAADFDRNGYTDLLYGSGNGVTFMKANNTGDGFIEISGSEYVFSQRSNFVDINNDGHLDAFVCHDVEPNVYYINDGNGDFIFNQGGLGDYPSGGNYGSIWIDYNNDHNIDLFIAKCGGEPARRTNQMHTNNGDGTYTENAAAIGLDDPMQTWSSAWADYDNDGDMDVFVGASSGTHKLMRNNGDATFTDVTAASGIAAVTATGIENTAYDFDNDGNMDIVSSGNILFGNGDLTFTNIAFNALPGTNGALGDLNNDGFIDSCNGGTIYWNSGNDNNWITINTIGTESNINGIGARIELETLSGVKIRDVRSGEGFGLMSTLNTHIGLGTETSIETITVYWPSGIIDIVNNPNINETLTIIEGEVLNIEGTSVTGLILYPNPAGETLNINEPYKYENAIYTIFSIDGKRILNNRLSEGSIDVSSLNAGTYILKIIQDGRISSQQFVKQ